ncbi:MAG TPA: glycogen debranching enzyme GlgX, partial [Sphingobacteriaceae bacterium]
SYFAIIQQDPVISQVKLIAEPWDIGEGGYQVGNFPAGWVEWNGKYRDCIRDYWRGEDSVLAEFAERFTGSSDLYMDDFRRPTASVNFVTAHDGFTLHDLVAYNEKHNEANGEENRDGESHNRSWNCGAEGETDDPGIQELRQRQKRNFLTTLFLSQGIPMLVAGDELGKTQAGNNNAYCQDNEISWINWQQADQELLDFTRSVIRLRRQHPAFRRPRWFRGKPVKGAGLDDIVWFLPSGKEMGEDNWNHDFAKSLAIFLNGKGLQTVNEEGMNIEDDHFYLIFNAHSEELEFTLPPEPYCKEWTLVLDTGGRSPGQRVRCGEKLIAGGRTVLLLTCELQS